MSAAQLTYWNIRPARSEEWQRTKHWNLYEQGWVAMTVCDVSSFELTRIMQWIAEQPSEDVHVCRHVLSNDSDEQIGSHKSDSRVFIFKHEAMRESFTQLLDYLPLRGQLVVVDRHKETAQHIKQLLGENINWMLRAGSHHSLLSMQDCREAVHAKIMFG